MYFKISKLHSWDKRSAARRRRFHQRFPKGWALVSPCEIKHNNKPGNTRQAEKAKRHEA